MCPNIWLVMYQKNHPSQQQHYKWRPLTVWPCSRPFKALCPQSQTAWWRWPGSRPPAPCRRNLPAGCRRQTPLCSCPVRRREQRPEEESGSESEVERVLGPSRVRLSADVPSPAACSSWRAWPRCKWWWSTRAGGWRARLWNGRGRSPAHGRNTGKLAKRSKNRE